MNRVILCGRPTKEPDISYSKGDSQLAIARYTLAVDRRIKKEGETSADFISCVTFGKAAEFVEKYIHKGAKILIAGRIQTGSYTNKDGQKVYTTEVVVEEHEFADSKPSSTGNTNTNAKPVSNDDFMNIPDEIEELPFK